MGKIFALAILLVPALLAAVPARAADPALVTGTEKYLRDDEKALLAALLTHPDLSAQFDAEAPLGLKDPKNLAPFLGVWRAKIEAFAETDSARGNPDLEGHYSSYAQLMTPEQRAYMIRRLGTMKEDDKNSLIGYLGSVNEALAKNGQLTWYTKKVVAGIMDQYRKDLSTYYVTPIAQTAKRDATTSAVAFAGIRKADEDARLAAATPVPPTPEVADAPVVKPPVPVKPAVKPAAKPVPTTKPAPVTEPVTPDAGSVVVTKPAGGALEQARGAANGGNAAGGIFDGGGSAKQPTSGDAVIVPAGSGTARPTLTPGKPGSESGLAGSIPPVPPTAAEASFEDSIKKMQTKPAPAPMVKRLAPIAGGLLGGLLGGLIGFLVGGPIGMIIGIGLGGAGGYVGGKMLAKKLFQ